MQKIFKTAAVLVCLAVASEMAYIEFRPYDEVKVVHTMAANETLWEVAWSYMDKQDKYKDVRFLLDDICSASGKGNTEFIESLHPGTQIVVPLKVAK